MQQSNPPQSKGLWTGNLVLPLLETIPDMVCLAGRDGYFLWLNDHFSEVLGYAKSELMGEPLVSFVHPADVQRTLTELDAVGGGAKTVDFKNRYRTKDGSYRHFQWTAHANHDGTTLGIARDVTPYLEATQAATTRADMLNMATEMAGIATWRVDLVSETVLWTPLVFKIHGRDELLGNPSLESAINYYHPDDRAAVGRAVEETIRSGEPFEFEKRILRDDGEERIVVSKGSVEFGPDGPTAMFGVFRDVSDQRAYEQSLRDAREEALAASRVKSQFLANMSHEVRTPLNGVLGMTELLAGTLLNPEQFDYVEHIQTSGQSLLHIVNDILDLSKIESGYFELERVPFSIEKVLQDVSLMLAPTVADKDLAFILSVDPDLPRSHLGDAVRFRQVVLNLVGNAVKFTESGEIEVRLQVEGDQLALVVRDTGVGICEERWASIFDPFTQEDESTTRKFGGTGLGLTIARQLVEQMGGELSVQSKQGVGTHFTATFALPVDDARRDWEPASVETSIIVYLENGLQNRVVSELLVRAGHKVKMATSESEVLGAMKATSTCQLLMDSSLWSEELERVASLLPGISVLSVSPYGGEGVGKDRRLRHPLFRDALLAAVNDEALSSVPLKRLSRGPALDDVRALRILLAEDNLVNTKVAKTILEKGGHEVVHASTGKEAVQAWESKEFDLVLMDVHMPELDGVQATQRIRAIEGQKKNPTPIVALTANAMKGDEQRCLNAGMTGYLSKPLDFEKLRRVLAEVGSARRQLAALVELPV